MIALNRDIITKARILTTIAPVRLLHSTVSLTQADRLKKLLGAPIRAGGNARSMSVDTLKLSEVIGALSHALDIAEGQPEGHCIRYCWIGMHIGQEIGIPEQERWDLYYALLLKDLHAA